MLTPYVFYFLSTLAIISALLVVFAKNPVHNVLYLVVTFFSIAGLYLLLNAQFLFAVQLIVYSGAIMVLFLFVLMLLNLNQDNEPQKKLLPKVIATASGGLMLVTLVGALRATSALQLPDNPDSQVGLVRNLGRVLFTDFVVPFEISSILFLAGMVGAVMMGKRDTTDTPA